jgi:hypothetical protein
MQSVPAWMYEAMAIVAFAMGLFVLLLGGIFVLLLGGIFVLWLGATPIWHAFFGRETPAKSDAAAETGEATTRASTKPAVAIILAGGLIWLGGGGGLIWLGLHYGFEFHERLIALVSPQSEYQVHRPAPPRDIEPSRQPRPSISASPCNPVEARYGLIIDAGSSGSRIYIYCWKPGGDPANRVPWVTAALGQQGKPLVFKFPTTPLSDKSCESDATNCLIPLIDDALRNIGNDPQITQVHLMATAGMRLKKQKNPEQSQVTMDTAEAYLKKTFKSASTVTSTIITPEQEALYGWIAVNYLMGFLKDRDGNSSPTMGILELGGASAQIAYASSDPSPQGLATEPWQWGKTKYQIYRHGFDGFGQNQALDKINAFYRKNNSSMIKERRPINPCYPINYRITGDDDVGEGTGNYNECKDEIKETLLPPLLNDLQMKNPRQPPHGVFLAYAGYYYTFSFLSKAFNKPILSPAELEDAGGQYCSEKWEKLDNWKELKSYSGEEYLPEWCFRAAYIAALLQTGYGFPNDTQQIFITDTIQGNDISWTLGAMVYQAGAKLP